jgi:hypothetical protein
LLIQRLRSLNIDEKKEVQVALDGHEVSLRMAFERIINLPDNLVVTNFNPGAWGEWYLKTVKRLSDMGYGFPLPAPSQGYKDPTAGEKGAIPEAKSSG